MPSEFVFATISFDIKEKALSQDDPSTFHKRKGAIREKVVR